MTPLMASIVTEPMPELPKKVGIASLTPLGKVMANVDYQMGISPGVLYDAGQVLLLPSLTPKVGGWCLVVHPYRRNAITKSPVLSAMKPSSLGPYRAKHSVIQGIWK